MDKAMFKKGDLVQYNGQTFRVVNHHEVKGLYYLNTLSGYFYGWVPDKHLCLQEKDMTPEEWFEKICPQEKLVMLDGFMGTPLRAIPLGIK